MAPAYSTLRYDLADAVAVVSLDRPRAMNAMNAAMATELADVLARIPADGGRALVLTGSTGVFSAGADLKEGAGEDWLATIEALMYAPVPTIAAVDGYCLGGGLLLAIACDMRVAGRRARFGAPEVRRGIFFGTAGTWLLPRIIGIPRSKQLLMTGEPIDADTALAWGLADRVADDALAEATTLARRFAEGAPVAIREVKALLDAALDRTYAEGVAAEEKTSARIQATEDAAEGVRAFIEKRAPRFTGR